MSHDSHVNCVQAISLGCHACGRQTNLETAEVEQKRCPRCGHVPAASLHAAGVRAVTTPRNRIKPMRPERIAKARERFTVRPRIAA